MIILAEKSLLIDDYNYKKAIDDLRIHQIELQMQNEELIQSKAKLEESEQRYKNMYQYSPIAYVTLDKNGNILEKNLSAKELLNSKSPVKKPFVVHVHS